MHDVAALADELSSLSCEWKSKSAGGGWSCITLRSGAGTTTPHLQPRVAQHTSPAAYRYTDAGRACPLVRALLDSLGTEVLLVRYLKLKPGELVKFHTDETVFRNTSKLVRLHLPVVTNPGAVLRFGTPLQEPAKGFMVWNAQQEWEVHMPAGRVWFTNVNALHSVYNGGSQDRIHLVVDARPQAGLDKRLKQWQNELIRDLV